jgi:hypothetical protein
MRYILFLVLIATGVNAKDEILTDKDLENKFISVIKDNEVEKKLQNSSEFQKCYKQFPYDPQKDSDQTREELAKKVEDCFKKGLKPDQLIELSDKFGLESHGLVESRNAKAITEYFTDKIYKSMTGIDRKAQKTSEMLKFKNRKLLDQKDFVDLYSNHLSKMVMMEISRFCFENLRISGRQNINTFAEHWEEFLKNGKFGVTPGFNDQGNGEFGNQIQDVSDTKKSYEGIFKGLTNVDTKNLNKFFSLCVETIPTLCTEFKEATAKNNGATPSNTNGSNACLSLSKLQEARRVINNTKKVQELYEKELVGGTALGLDNGQVPQHFVASGDNSFNNITSFTSYDILEGGLDENDQNNELAKKCSEEPDDAECEKFIVIDDSRKKALFDSDISQRIKKQGEVERIKKLLSENKKDLETYLEENGYLDLLDKFKKGELADSEIEKEVEKIFDAKRVATLKAIQDKVGSRQLTENEIGNDKQGKIKASAKETSTERARIAQVVLFNNILTSFVIAKDNNTGKERQFGTSLKQELKSLESDTKGKIDENLFAGFKQSFQEDSGPGNNGNESVSIQFLDQMLGAPDTEEKK